MALENVNPVIFKRTEERDHNEGDEDNDVTDEIDSREIFGILFAHSPMVLLGGQTRFNI